MLLESNTVQLLRALFTTTAEKYKFPLRGAINVQRLDATIKCSLEFQARGKPYHTSLAYIRKEDHDAHRNVPILEDPTFLDVNVNDNDVFVLCAILPGTIGMSLSNTAVDTASAVAQNGGYIIRDNKQIFPLMEIRARHMKDKRERVIILQKHVLDTVNGFFGVLRPGGDAEETTTGEAKAKPAVQHDTVQIWDVACDRTDERCANHFGNRRFAVITCIFMAKNFDLLRQDVRRRVAAQVVRIIEEGNPFGRFLGKTTRGTWKQLDQDLAVRWVSSILKTAAENAEEKRKCDAIDGLLGLAGLKSNCCDNVDEPYGPIIHASDDGMNKANQDEYRSDRTNVPQVVASGSGDDGPFQDKPNKGGCGGGKSPQGDSDNEEDEDDDDENNDAEDDDVENAVEVEAVETHRRDGPNVLADMDMDEDAMAEVDTANEEEAAVEVDGSNNPGSFADIEFDVAMDDLWGVVEAGAANEEEEDDDDEEEEEEDMVALLEA